MRRVSWVTNTCHFVPGIRSACYQSNFWVRSNDVTVNARGQALEKVLSQLRCVTYGPTETHLDTTMWSLTSAGMLRKPTLVPDSPSYEVKCPLPTARDSLLFATIDYHVMREWEVQSYSKELLCFQRRTCRRLRSSTFKMRRKPFKLLLHKWSDDHTSKVPCVEWLGKRKTTEMVLMSLTSTPSTGTFLYAQSISILTLQMDIKSR
ncbi:hypothetical protein HYPSUDRAFT_34398 [Hypholoma sublateritium FD-334 SS-4]|uniref:Uncharacterized protein n=1 Tax=Hypholoma sublateritium (strain FD-334 SS-4) TaxID=945553 RepID=A0A0D2Q8P5_HYPSF|nr:hypothetical protein HYPSUDRAFT_34398 [Hypholoma sublateritium FD-334 SS-4]